MGKIVIAVAALLVLLGGGYYFIFGSAAKPASSDGFTISMQNATTTITPAGSAGATQTTTNPTQKIMKATLHTTKGDIVIEFSAETPKTVENFTKLAKAGFYDGTKFHRVIKAFMIQGGDPLSKDDAMMARWGTGGPGYQFADEIGANNHNAVGTIAMANAGPDTNGSQFFINVADNNFLDTKHTVFGKVISGMDAVHAIEQTPTGQGDRPLSPMVITSITLE